jgi:hypothetical protein
MFLLYSSSFTEWFEITVGVSVYKPHFIDTRHTDGGEVVTLTRSPVFTPPGKFLGDRAIAQAVSRHSWPIVPASGDSEDDCGEADGM